MRDKPEAPVRLNGELFWLLHEEEEDDEEVFAVDDVVVVCDVGKELHGRRAGRFLLTSLPTGEVGGLEDLAGLLAGGPHHVDSSSETSSKEEIILGVGGGR